MRRLQYPFALFILSLVLSASSVSSASAQQVELRKQPQAVQVKASAGWPGEDQVVHRTPEFMRSDEGRAALAEIQNLRKLGLLNKGGSQTSPALTPGTERSFQLLDIASCSQPGGCQYFSETFTLVSSEASFNIWIANPDLASNGGRMVESDWVEFSEALGNSTPAESWNPNMGIIEIDEAVFGPPSDIDGNGKVDVLVHDIKDQYDPAGGVGLFTAGYFSPADLSNNGNNADIIHLDTYPSIYNASGDRRGSEFVLQTLAHEYQHLIFAVRHGGGDLAFLDEGLAEWAEVVNGYAPRTITYLSDAGEIARPLLDWRDDPNGAYGGPQSQDYQRAGLFHHYLAERLSTEIVGAMSRGDGVEVGNYIKMFTDNQLDASLLRDMVQGFHTANLINDQAISPTYGYHSSFRNSIKATGFQTIDGTQTSSSTTNGNLNPGSVRYVKWSQVGSFTLDITSSTGADRLMPVLLVKPAFGTMQRVFPEVGGEPTLVSGNFEEVYVVLPHVDLTQPVTADPTTYSISASWEDFTGNAQYESVAYEAGEAAINDGALFGFGLGGSLIVSLPAESEFANAFDIPDGGALASVDVSLLFFENLKDVSPTSSVRDFTLKIYADQDGEPGDLILSKYVPWTTAVDISEFNFQTVDLSDDVAILENYQGRIYVGLADAGLDDNHVYVPFFNQDHNDTVSPSYMYTQFSNSGLGWASFDNVQDGGGNSVFEGYVLPIRATIDLVGGSTDTELDASLPRMLTLQQNYPNPFNPSTNVRFSLPSTSDVQVQVFDLLGRNVATLVNGTLPAGQHEVTFDASDLTSGLYLYTITAGSQRISRTMTLIK